MLKILGIETSCDETSVAIVREDRKILVNLVKSQIEEHRPYAGVVPEIAARAHIEYLEDMIKKAEIDSCTSLKEIDAIAVTSGPGLIGGLIVGLMTAKGLSHSLNKPLLSINHLEGHALAPRLTNDIAFPYLILLISGGHCQILVVENIGKYQLLGSTRDDAVGEAFDKLAKMMNLGYPGGPLIEKMAQHGNYSSFKLPIGLHNSKNCEFSFSGLKTCLRNIIDQKKQTNSLTTEVMQDLAASFQYNIVQTINEKLYYAFKQYENIFPNNKRLVISGGVAANKYIRKNLEIFCNEQDYELYFPPIELCTDNAAMIAWTGIERYKLGLIDDLKVEPKTRWPLDASVKK